MKIYLLILFFERKKNQTGYSWKENIELKKKKTGSVIMYFIQKYNEDLIANSAIGSSLFIISQVVIL